jgi:sporulation protein YtfJ
MDISGIVTSLMEQIKETVRSETVVGAPVQAEDSVIIPVSRVTFGFGVGGGTSDASTPQKGSGAATGCGATIEPVAFVVVSKGKAQILPLKSREATLTHIIDLVPSLLEFVRDWRSKGASDDQGGDPDAGDE